MTHDEHKRQERSKPRNELGPQPTKIHRQLNTPMAVFTTMSDECLTTSTIIKTSIATLLKKNHITTQPTRENAIYHRDMLMVRLSRMELAHSKLKECASAHDIDESCDDGMVEIEEMVNRARMETATAKAMTDQLLQLRKETRRAEGEKQKNETTTIGSVTINPKETAAQNDEVEETREKRPNGTIRYMYAVCDDQGRYCDDEVGKIEATIDNIILPEKGPEWREIIRDTGRAVANEMMNSRHELLVPSLVKINIQRVSGETTSRDGNETGAEAGQEKPEMLSQEMSREDENEWPPWLKEKIKPVKDTSEDEAEKLRRQQINQPTVNGLGDAPPRLQMVCYPTDSENIPPGQENSTENVDNMDQPLVVKEDEHGFRDMYWCRGPTAERCTEQNEHGQTRQRKKRIRVSRRRNE